MGITVVQLECFLEVVKQGNFSLAAANLYMSQPTLSRNIQSLEEELRTLLFHRANNTVHLTEIGRELHPKLEQMYQFFRTATDELHEIVDRSSGRLRVGVLASLRLDDRVRSAITHLRSRFPNARVQLCHLDLRQSHASLMSGTVDALLSLNAVMPPSDKVRSLVLSNERMCLAVPSDHPNADLPSLDHDQIPVRFPGLDYFVLAAGEFESPVQQDLMHAQPNYGDELLSKLSGPFATMDALMLMADGGLGITCVNETCILSENPRIRLIPLVERRDGKVFPSLIGVTLYWVEKNENPLLRVLIQEVRDRVQAQADGGPAGA